MYDKNNVPDSDDATEVCITIDTEFSIAGHFNDPEKYKPLADPVVYCHDGTDEQGLGFMLKTFDRFGIKASFFVEAANSFYFGDAPMQRVVDRLIQAGQDVQLHIHPVWLSFDQPSARGGFPRNDDCDKRSFEDLKLAFSKCIEVFERWTGHPPLAIRTGSLRSDENVYHVMHELGIPLSSNIALGVFSPRQKALHKLNGRHNLFGVMELPVFTYQDSRFRGNPHLKSLQITSCSWPEMKHLLWKARKSGVRSIVILTHPFEFVKKSDFQYTRLHRNRINQRRLEQLCEFIASHPGDFKATTFTSSFDHWTNSEESERKIAIPGYYAVGRKLHNRLNDVIWHY